MDNLSDIIVGEYLWTYSASWSTVIITHKVVRLTDRFLIIGKTSASGVVEELGKVRKSDGLLMGSSNRYNSTYYHKLTPEIREQLAVQQVQQVLQTLAHTAIVVNPENHLEIKTHVEAIMRFKKQSK